MPTLTIVLLVVLLSGVVPAAYAGEVEFVHASFRLSCDSRCSVNVTLRHSDTCWGHCADAWPVVDTHGQALSTCTL